MHAKTEDATVRTSQDWGLPLVPWQGSGPVPVMPRHIPAELSAWMGERQADLHDALADGVNARVLEITSKLSEGAEHTVELTGGMIP